eukprot:TRINITY_DN10673_c0_g1_i1.p1 TRINITY_DN10673_c0_g1~~TRINITY_DN10673_c0_g1_i1.p1  ORF type:complete len:243 (-),score=31.23 TRINITY_DN10673_c0_g1_i1:171-899(-)
MPHLEAIHYKTYIRRVRAFLDRVVSVLRAIFDNVLSYTFGVFDLVAKFFVFILLLYYFVDMEDDPLTKGLRALSLSEEVHNKLNEQVVTSIRGVFVSSVYIFIYHLVLTWFIFDIVGLPLKFIFSSIASTLSIVPFIQPYYIMAIAILYNFLVGNCSVITSIIFFAIYWYYSSSVPSVIYEKEMRLHGYFTVLSVFLGLMAFGLVGILYGPLIVSGVAIVYKLKNELNFSQNFFRERQPRST